MPMSEAVRYRKKGIRSGTGMLRSRTEILDAGGIGLDADAQLCLLNSPVKLHFFTAESKEHIRINAL